MNEYKAVTTRFLRQDERLILSDEIDMPLVIEAGDLTSLDFLHTFLNEHSSRILEDISKFGAVLLRGFAISSDAAFEKTVLSINGLKGISDAFMSEEGRIPVDNLKYILHTNAVYKTGGTLYLGGFHTENYYSTDVPAYICFYCSKPSELGGETGLINMEKIYQELSPQLQAKLEEKSFVASQWLVSEVAERYNLSPVIVEKICAEFDLPIVGQDQDKIISMHKPSVILHPETQKKSLQINLFELKTLNEKLRAHFMNDYQGKTWFWHRFVWKLPTTVFGMIERIAVAFLSFFHSPKDSLNILRLKVKRYKSLKKNKLIKSETKVESCFTQSDVDELAILIRRYYSSCLWQKGDVLLVDNRKVAHAGMPGSGPRLVRAMICNPIDMGYSSIQPGLINCVARKTETIGACMSSASAKLKTESSLCEHGEAIPRP